MIEFDEVTLFNTILYLPITYLYFFVFPFFTESWQREEKLMLRLQIRYIIYYLNFLMNVYATFKVRIIIFFLCIFGNFVFPPFYTRIINQVRPCFSYEHIAVKLIHNIKLLFNNIVYDDYNNNIKRCLQSFRSFYNLQHIHDHSKQHTSQFPIKWRHTINVCLLLIKVLQFSRDTFINLLNVL